MTTGLALPPQEGVHLFMDELDYFDAPALGSSDFLTLFNDPATWWYGSPHNPQRRAKVSRANHLNFGSGLHTLLLEGRAAFDERFTMEPDDTDLDWLRTTQQIYRALRDKGVDVRDMTKQTLYSLARKHGIAHRVWALAWADYEKAKRAGAERLSQDEDRRLRHMVRLIQEHPDMGPALASGISEVTVFWRDKRFPEILFRCRFDKLLAQWVIDLKSISNYRGGDPDEATFQSIIKFGYDLQAEHYRAGRMAAIDFIKRGQIYVWNRDGESRKLSAKSPHMETLRAVADAGDAWKWSWIFYQVRNDDAGQERAPVVVPWAVHLDDPLFPRARATIDQAIGNYSDYVGRFGLTSDWSEIRPLRHLPSDRLKPLEWKRKADE